MRRVWMAALALAASWGLVTTSLGCGSISPTRMAGMMEQMHPGFLAGLLDGSQ